MPIGLIPRKNNRAKNTNLRKYISILYIVTLAALTSALGGGDN